MDGVRGGGCGQRRHWQASAVLFAMVLAGCASNPPAPVEDRQIDSRIGTPRALPQERSRHSVPDGTYRVQAGDTLYSIAFRHGVDFRDIARWNRIQAPHRIYVGQALRLAGAVEENGVATAAIKDSSLPAAVTSLSPEASKPGSKTRPVTAPAALPPSNEVAAATSATKPVPENSVAAASREVPIAPVAAVPVPPTPKEVAIAPAASTTVEPTKPGALAPGTNSVAVAAAGSGAATLTNGGIVWRWPASGKVVGTFASGDQTRQGVDIAGTAGTSVLAAADGSVVYSGNGLLGYGELVIVKHSASFLSAYGHNRKRLVKEGDKVKAGQVIAEMGASAANRDMLHFEIRRNGKPVNPLEFLPAH